MKGLNEDGKRIVKIAAIIIFMFWMSNNVGVVLGVINNVLGVMTPVIIGGVIAFVVCIPMRPCRRLLNKLKVSEKYIDVIAFAMSFLCIAFAIIMLLILVIPELENAFEVITEEVPRTYDKIEGWVIDNREKFPALSDMINSIEIDWNSLFDKLTSFITGGVAGVFDTTFNVVAVVIGGIYNLLMSLIVAVYMVFNRARLGKQAKKLLLAYFPEKIYNKCIKIGNLSMETFSQFIVGKGIDAITMGLMCFIGMMIFNFPYAAMISVFVGVSAMIPIIGAYIGTAVGALLILFVSPVQALWFVVYMVVLQLFEGNVIYPKIMGSTVGLPALWTIIAITLGGGMFGFVGMLIAVPVVSVIYALVKESVEARLSSKITVPTQASDEFLDVDDEILKVEKEASVSKEVTISNGSKRSKKKSKK